MMNLRDILTECLVENDLLKFEAFVFGSDDFLASIGKSKFFLFCKYHAIQKFPYSVLIFTKK